MLLGPLLAVPLDVASDHHLDVGVEHDGFSSVMGPIVGRDVWSTSDPLPARR